MIWKCKENAAKEASPSWILWTAWVCWPATARWPVDISTCFFTWLQRRNGLGSSSSLFWLPRSTKYIQVLTLPMNAIKKRTLHMSYHLPLAARPLIERLTSKVPSVTAIAAVWSSSPTLFGDPACERERPHGFADSRPYSNMVCILLHL